MEKVLSGLVYQNFDIVRPAIKIFDFVIWRRRRNCLRPKSADVKSVFLQILGPGGKISWDDSRDQMTAPFMRKYPYVFFFEGQNSSRYIEKTFGAFGASTAEPAS